jgi:cyclopropane-fatty-acyl-phospholipid synthase
MPVLLKPKAQGSESSRSDSEGTYDEHLGIALVEALWGELHPRDFAVRFWDGATWPEEPGCSRRFTLVLESPSTLFEIVMAPTDLALGEAYAFRGLDIEGDVESALDLADELLRRRREIRLVEGIRLWLQLRSLTRATRTPSSAQPGDRIGNGAHEPTSPPRRSGRARSPIRQSSAGRWGRPKPRQKHTPAYDKSAIAYHYDVSNEFYQLWLDRRMVYSCAYFATPDEDLDSAQERKLNYICRKLRLQPGERLLDLGCGWGGLVMHAVQQFGVHALGITLSRAQAEFAGRRIEELGLSDRCRVEHQDYRKLAAGTASNSEAAVSGRYDKIACVGMFEHVGEASLLECLKQTWDLLKPGGAFLFHGITRGYHSPLPEPSFVTRYVFPNGELVPISTILQAAEKAGFEVRDAESLREHYVLTLRRWVERLEANCEEATRLTDAETYRVWKLFMAASAQRFRVAKLNLHQVLLAKPDSRGSSRLPLTRADWYAS